jgi:RNA polymerase sigma factor (sigma-70 family)
VGTEASTGATSGSNSDFDAVFREHYPRLVARGIAMSGSVDVGHDVAQEAMSRAYHRWSEVSHYEHLGGWLQRVVANLLIDRHRARSAEERATARSPGWAEVTRSPEVSEWHRLVDGLPVQQRVIVTLYYGVDWSVEEIADHLGIHEGTVKSSLFKARQSLRRRIETDLQEKP